MLGLRGRVAAPASLLVAFGVACVRPYNRGAVRSCTISIPAHEAFRDRSQPPHQGPVPVRHRHDE
jgi:hypothetical protein